MHNYRSVPNAPWKSAKIDTVVKKKIVPNNSRVCLHLYDCWCTGFVSLQFGWYVLSHITCSNHSRPFLCLWNGQTIIAMSANLSCLLIVLSSFYLPAWVIGDEEGLGDDEVGSCPFLLDYDRWVHHVARPLNKSKKYDDFSMTVYKIRSRSS